MAKSKKSNSVTVSRSLNDIINSQKNKLEKFGEMNKQIEHWNIVTEHQSDSIDKLISLYSNIDNKLNILIENDKNDFIDKYNDNLKVLLKRIGKLEKDREQQNKILDKVTTQVQKLLNKNERNKATIEQCLEEVENYKNIANDIENKLNDLNKSINDNSSKYDALDKLTDEVKKSYEHNSMILKDISDIMDNFKKVTDDADDSFNKLYKKMSDKIDEQYGE